MAASGRKNADQALIVALAAAASVQEAACQAGLSARTTARRLADPTFRERVACVRAELVQKAVAKLADGMADAAEKLRALLSAQSESVQLHAARAILETGVRLREATELEERLRTLEHRLQPEEA